MDELEAARGNIVTRLAIGNIPHSATQILSNAVKELLSRHPIARVQILDGHYEELLNELRAGKLDLLFGVLRRPDWANDVKEELLFAIMLWWRSSRTDSIIVRHHLRMPALRSMPSI